MLDRGRPLSFIMDDHDGHDFIVHTALKHGLSGYEEPFPAFIVSLVTTLRGDVLDIGANTGLYSLLAASASDDVTVHAFEPVPGIADGFVLNAGLNASLRERLHLHRLAISDVVGEAVLHETQHRHFMSTTSGLNAEFSMSHGRTVAYPVRVTTLDAFVADQGIGAISFIKVDVEGHEREVIAGALGTVRSHRPFFGVELLREADFAYFTRFLRDHGYVDGALRPGSLRLTQAPEFIQNGWNHILIPEEKRDLAKACAASIGLDAVDG